jgi:hypothetical protein
LVHSSFLTETSTFFKAAIGGNFKGAVGQQVKMPGGGEATFEHFVRWLYSGCREKVTPTEDIFTAGTTAANIKDIVGLFVLGDKVGCQELKHDMVRQYHLLLDSVVPVIPLESIEYLYGRPISTEPLREMTVAYFVWIIPTQLYKTGEALGELLAKLPEFTKEVLIEMGSRYGVRKAINPLKKGVNCFLAKV